MAAEAMPLARTREDVRRSQLLRTHLEVGQWKTETWGLADSLAWALEQLDKVDDVGELELAHLRLDRVRKELGDGR